MGAQQAAPAARLAGGGGVTEQDLQQLLKGKQLQTLCDGTSQAICNVLIALAHMATERPPLVGRSFAQQCSTHLFTIASTRLIKGNTQDIGNAMWAAAELGLPATVFVTKAVGSASAWVPNSKSTNLTQAAFACALLQHKSEVFMGLLLQRASELLRQQAGYNKAPRGRSRAMSAVEKASLAAVLAASIVQLDMQQLAGPARNLVASSEVGQEPNTHPSTLRRLWVFHSWLLQHQLLDGKGLTGILTEQQLPKGEQEAAVYGTGIEGSKQG